MTCHDWRDASPDALAPLYAAERRRWSQALSWDLGPSLALVEQARVRGDLPGVLVRARDGEPVGWSFYVLAQGLVQIGALNAPTAAALRSMLAHVFASPEAQLAQGVSCFLFPVSPSVTSALTRQRFTLETHRYLVLPLRDAAGAPFAHSERLPSATRQVRPWETADTPAAVRLLARAYAGDPSARCFAPRGRMEEWAHYVGQLIASPACGAFAPDATFVAPGAGSGSLDGLVVTTMVAPATAHIAQVVVDPAGRRQGLASTLVDAAIAHVRGQGARRITLLVGEENAGARALYAGFGFVEGPAFLSGTRGPVPRRLGDESRPRAVVPGLEPLPESAV